MSESQGISGGTVFLIILVVTLLLAVGVLVFLLIKKNGTSECPECPECTTCPVPSDAIIKDDVQVIYDKVDVNKAEGRQFNNTYFKKLLFKCAGNDVPDTYWKDPFNVEATSGNQFGVKAPEAKPPVANAPVANAPVANAPVANAPVANAPKAGESFINISHNQPPLHRYPFW